MGVKPSALTFSVDPHKDIKEPTTVTIELADLRALHARNRRLLEYGNVVCHTSDLLLKLLLGRLRHWAQYLPRRVLRLRLVQRWFSSRWNQSHGRWTDTVVPDSRLISHLRWFQKRAPWKQGIPLHPPTPSQDLFSDASSTGWGAQLGESSVSGEWDCLWRHKHINILELRAVVLACRKF